MKPSYLFALIVLGLVSFMLFLVVLAHGTSFPLLFPFGAIGIAERDLMIRALFLMCIVVVPVFILAIFIAWHYRESNTHAKYTPDWEHSRMEELIWWSIPLEIVLVLGALTWTSTHELDPIRPIQGDGAPLTVQVVALPWKWLFIYPEEGIATVNQLAMPVNRPVRFEITADAPMNSFWIPALGGQMYAMTGMTTILYLNAKQPGEYPGRSANYSGEGFAQMQFTVKAMSDSDFDAWLAMVRDSEMMLAPDSYALMRKPSDAGPVQYFGKLGISFADILNSYMLNGMQMNAMPSMAH